METDKANVELSSPITGTVKEVHTDEDDVVAVGTVIVAFEGGGGSNAGTESTIEPDSSAADARSIESELRDEAADAATDFDGVAVSVSEGYLITPRRVTLENAGIEPNDDGFIETDDRTEVEQFSLSATSRASRYSLTRRCMRGGRRRRSSPANRPRSTPNPSSRSSSPIWRW